MKGDLTQDQTLNLEQGEQDDSQWTWHSWQVILLITNAILGLAWFEWAWWKNRRFRKPIPELEALLPAFRRTDAHRWSKWKFYPGAMTVLIPRFLFGVVMGMLVCLCLFFMLIGQPMD